MKILVCISKVPDTTTKINVGEDKKSIDSKGVKFILNPYDEFAIEEGLRIKEQKGGEVTVLTVGDESNQDILRTALAMGADNAVLVKASYDFDSFQLANNIANYAKKYNPDLILLGRQSIDFDSFQVPSLLATLLDFPSVSVVSKLTIDSNKIIAERDIEGGKEIVETSLPCIISTQKGINEPRYPKLPDIMKAKKKNIEEFPFKNTNKYVEILSLQLPDKKRVGKIVGDSESEIQEIVNLLHNEAKII
jgi:electron transfer flavoprotein beta subunit